MAGGSPLMTDARTQPEPLAPFAQIFSPGRLTFGLVLPLMAERGAETSVEEQLDLAALADRLGQQLLLALKVWRPLGLL